MRTLLGDFAGGPVVTTLRLQYRASISGRGTRSHVSCGGTKKQVNKQGHTAGKEGVPRASISWKSVYAIDIIFS